MNRDEFRKVKNMSKQDFEIYLSNRDNIMYNNLRKQFNAAYKDELDNSISNFLFALAYTLHFNEDINIKNDEMVSFMDDLYITVDMFRTGEYKPEEYIEALREDGVKFNTYDNNKIFRELEDKYKAELDFNRDIRHKAISLIEDNSDYSKDDLINILRGELNESKEC